MGTDGCGRRFVAISVHGAALVCAKIWLFGGLRSFWDERKEEVMKSIQEKAKARDLTGVPSQDPQDRGGVLPLTNKQTNKQWSGDQTQTRPRLVLLHLL